MAGMSMGTTDDLLGMPSVRAIIYTRGDGTPDRVLGDESIDAEKIAAWLDVSAGALNTIQGAGLAKGPLHTAILLYPGATLVVGTLSTGRKVAVLASEDSSLGLVLTQLRRLVQEAEV